MHKNPVSFLLYYLLEIPGYDFPKAVTRLGVKDKITSASQITKRERADDPLFEYHALLLPEYRH